LSDDSPADPSLPATEEETGEPAGSPELAPTAPDLVAPEVTWTNPEAETFHRRARLAEDRLAEVLGAYRQLKQETETFRERMSRGIERRYEDRRDQLLLTFIEILDNFDRALDAAEKSGAHDALIQGLILVRTQLIQTLREQGLERIPVLGLPYDPECSEVVELERVDDPDQDHTVVRELQRGYRLSGRVARPSRVVVGEYQHEEPPPPAAEG
jgi:molecular chaperone GrpE